MPLIEPSVQSLSPMTWHATSTDDGSNSHWPARNSVHVTNNNTRNSNGSANGKTPFSPLVIEPTNGRASIKPFVEPASQWHATQPLHNATNQRRSDESNWEDYDNMLSFIDQFIGDFSADNEQTKNHVKTPLNV